MIYPITPVGKPRMTQRDRWKQPKRPAVQRYHAMKDEVRLRGVSVPEGGGSLIFHMPMPESWSARRKCKMAGQPHQQRPDLDNLVKAVLDSIYDDDAVVHDLRVQKVWSYDGAIEVIEGE